MDYEKLYKEVEKIWADVFTSVNEIVKSHLNFGYTAIAVNIHPSIDDMLLSLKVVESGLDTVYASGKLQYEETRLILIAKQQIHHVQRVAEALKNENEADYEAAMKELECQVQF